MRCLEAVSIYILIIYHFSFFWRFYKNPYLLNTSEVASNYYPHWRWMGRCLNGGRLPFTDKIYYLYPACIPFLSTFYPPSVLVSLTGNFRAYVYLILIHYLIGSFLAYYMLLQWFSPVVSLFGALSLVYNGYCIKVQTPCFSFTHCWIMGILIPGWIGATSLGLAILGGYWPILLTVLPMALLNPSCVWGLMLALPQTIPFLWYFPKSIRAKTKVDPKWGRMPISRFFFSSCFPENGIHYPEYSFGIGVCAILAFLHPNYWALFAIFSFLASQGFFSIARIPSRFVYFMSFAMIMCSLNAIRDTIYIVPLIVGQMILLWKWRNQYPHFPFSQWWKKKHTFKGINWPNNTGYMNEEHHHNYFGGFSLAENHIDK